MNAPHAKSPCCKAKIHHFGVRRRQCSHCKRTWRIRRKKRGRKPWRASRGVLQAVLLQGSTLKHLASRYGLTPQGFSLRFRRAMQQFVSQPRLLSLPGGRLVLVVDGLWFRFEGRLWVLYLMGLKSTHQNRAVFLDPLLLPGKEQVSLWAQAFATIPPPLYKRIRALVCDDIRGMIGLAAQHHWIVQLCHFHLISRLHRCRGRRNQRLAGRSPREALYQLTRQALDLPNRTRLEHILKRLTRLVHEATGTGVMSMMVREFLRRIDQFRAYQSRPELHLPTTTGTVEAMGRKMRDLMRQTRSIRSPQALQLWATALIRMRPFVMCNGKHVSTK